MKDAKDKEDKEDKEGKERKESKESKESKEGNEGKEGKEGNEDGGGHELPLSFEIYKGGARVAAHTLNQDVIKVGRLSSAHLRIDDESIARMHALIQVAGPGEVYLSDLGSARGTRVNGRRITKTRLASGDRLQMGEIELRVRIAPPRTRIGSPVPALSGAGTATAARVRREAETAWASAAGAAKEAAASARLNRGEGPARGASSGHGASGASGGLQRDSSFVQSALTAREVAAVEETDGSQAVELEARYQGETHQVHHFADPRGGRPRLRSLAALALGLAAAVGGGVLFGTEIARVRYQKDKQRQIQEFIKTRGLPDKFVPRVRSSATNELLGAGGFVLGLFGLLWGGLRCREELREPSFTIGEHPDSTFHTPTDALPPQAARFPLLRSDGSAFHLCFTAKMEGDAEVGGERISLPDLVRRGLARSSAAVPGAYEWPLPEGTNARLEMGDGTFVLRSVARGKAVAAAPLPVRAAALLTAPATLTTLGSFAVIGAFGLLMSLSPGNADALETDSVESSGRFKQVLREELQQQQKDRPQQDREPPRIKPRKMKQSPKTRTKGPVADKDERIRSTGSGPASPNHGITRHSSARSSGMPGVLSSLSQKLGSMFSRDSALSSDQEDALGALQGHTVGDKAGLGALGIGPGGRGGGGHGAGGVGFGGWCDGMKECGNAGWNTGPGGLLGTGGTGVAVGDYRGHKPVVDIFSEADVQGSLDGRTIRRIIRRHLQEVQYCYVSVGLPTNPRLSGTVKVAFTIQSNGRVGKVQIVDSSLGHRRTEACIRAAVRRWRFPKPGGSMPFVSYPFRFRPAGQ